MAETRKRGGPTQHTYATVPGEWTGRYQHPGFTPGQTRTGIDMRHNQMSTILSLLTPEYQQRMVQQAFHEGNQDKAQWPSQYCWPEGFMRRWHEYATWEWDFIVTPSLVQIRAGVARNFITNIHVGREFKMDGPGVPRLGADVPRWYGETHRLLGQGHAHHLDLEHPGLDGARRRSSTRTRCRRIEIYSPNRDASGKFIGLNHEAIFYDPEALVEPIRIIRNYVKLSGFETGRSAACSSSACRPSSRSRARPRRSRPAR